MPRRLATVNAHTGTTEGGDAVDLALVAGDVAVGDWILVHAGIAVNRLEPDDARAVLDALAAVEAAARGEPIDHLFADLIGREPELPAHLRAEAGE